MSNSQIITGDCLEVMRTLADNSVDAIVTDPPYGLKFMGKRWDCEVPGVPVWAECLRVLKPGGHLLAFAGTRTQHRMCVNIEDAGFEIRDTLAWVYGSGFPKSLDVSKAIDHRERGRMVREKLMHFAKVRGIDGKWLESHGVASASSFNDWTIGGHVPSQKNWLLVKEALGVTADEEATFEREVVGHSKNGIAGGSGKHAGESGAYGFSAEFAITAPATEAAKQWQGWGTALKPAFEPITLARKPLTGTVAANVLEWGTGAVNVDGCRVDRSAGDRDEYGVSGDEPSHTGDGNANTYGVYDRVAYEPHSAGRWPANFLHDGSDEVTDLLGDAARFFYCAKASKKDRDEGLEWMNLSGAGRTCYDPKYHEGGGKLPPRSGNHHPTVKPTDLMRYLCRLITPPNGLILDPFTGSGSTGKAAMLEGFRFIGIEREAEYAEIAKARIAFSNVSDNSCPLFDSPIQKDAA